MKKIYTLSTFLLVMQLAAQNQVNYKITRNAPELSEISNIYVAPKFILDIPFYQQRMEDPTDAMLLYTIGLGITTHAIVREKFFVDINMNTAYTLLGGGRFRDLNLGGAYLLNTKTRNKMLKVVLESKEVSREKIAFENKEKVVVSENYIKVEGKQTTYNAVRGGFFSMSSFFDGNFTDFGDVKGQTSTNGAYVGLARGVIRNLEIQEKSGRRSSAEAYWRFYADLMLGANNHELISGTATAEIKGAPLGFRAGYDFFRPTMGSFNRFVNIEVGYRPGLNGYYIQFGFGFQFRNIIVGM